MRVFISSSGPASTMFARRFAEWLPNVLQSAETRLFHDDVQAGTTIRESYLRAARRSNFVVFCLSRQALQSTWLNFEAGLIMARTTDRQEGINVAAILLGMKATDLSGPLASLPAFESERGEVWNLVRTINAVAGPDATDVARLDRAFEVMWPDLAVAIAESGDRTLNPEPRRSLEDKVDEVLILLRRLSSDRGRRDEERAVSRAVDFEALALAEMGLPPGTVIDKRLADEIRFRRNRLAHEAATLSPEQRLRRTEIETAILKQFNRWGHNTPQREIDFVWTGRGVTLYTDLPITQEDLEILESVVRSSDVTATVSGIYTRRHGPFESEYERTIYSKYSGLDPDAPVSFTRSNPQDDEGRI